MSNQFMLMDAILDLARSAYLLLIRAATSLQSLFLLVVRLYWGWQFFLSGKGHLSNLTSTTEYFASLHIPFPQLNVILSASTECFGGLLLLVGLASRPIAIPLIVSMLVAFATAEHEKLVNIFSDPDKFVTADPFLFLFASLLVLFFGPGIFSLDHLLKNKMALPASEPTATPAHS